jgi:hypothetical protein
MFYNCENLFDSFNDSTTDDDEFTPEGSYYWTYSKYLSKLQKVAQVIVSAGSPEPPAIIGLCEIENKMVLNKLVFETQLLKYNYKTVHYDSPDKRGIDVALLYNPLYFKPILSKQIRVYFPFDTVYKTRDILHVYGVLYPDDTIGFFVNHWPSKANGELSSIPYRNYTARVLKEQVLELLNENPKSKIIAMGDFNDLPGSSSISFLTDSLYRNQKVLNNATIEAGKNFPGTIKHDGQWFIFDQFLLSNNLYKNEKWHVTAQSCQIFHEPFLLKEDNSGNGFLPNRTFVGRKYNNGFSDHLPVILELYK